MVTFKLAVCTDWVLPGSRLPLLQTQTQDMFAFWKIISCNEPIETDMHSPHHRTGWISLRFE